MKVPFKRGNILLPKNANMEKWSVVACDQYTSEPEYWSEVEEIVGNEPSTLKLTLPEIYLEESDVDARISKINANMEELISEDFFKEYKDSMIYLRRTQKNGKVREGLMGIVDLEGYSYEVGSKTPIRATEKTVIERIPPRVKIRENAELEFPHIMILIDDAKKEIIESLASKVTEEDVVYDFSLMKDGGHIKGYLLGENEMDFVDKKLEELADEETFNKRYGVSDKGVLLFAMGDGNHSLATAKACYEALKKTMSEEDYLNHPARYALVELVNLHSEALEFEAINRVVFDTDVDSLVSGLKKYYNINKDGNGQKFEIITDSLHETWYIENPKSNIAVGSIQMYLDEFLKENAGKVDYIHGEDVTIELTHKGANNVGFIFDAMPKSELFKTVILDGSLPRKTFSMGHSYDKRYYLEARKIK